MNRHSRFTTLFAIGVLLLLSGCAGLIEGKRSRQTSSVVDYLYPDKQNAVDSPSVPSLKLPLNVGIAFVPSAQGRYTKRALDENQKMRLMERIADDFRQYDFINNIEFIPSQYLRPQGSFDNLEQIKTMYGIDVMTLLSYDQVQYTDEGLLSLTYWTIVGAYIFQGEKNDTSTMVDAAVYDIASRKMLFRAPGVSQVKGSATFVNQSEELRADSLEGFSLAADDLVVNLKRELERFKEKLKAQPESARISYRKGYSGGGGAFGAGALLMLLLCWTLLRYPRRKGR